MIKMNKNKKKTKSVKKKITSTKFTSGTSPSVINIQNEIRKLRSIVRKL